MHRCVRWGIVLGSAALLGTAPVRAQGTAAGSARLPAALAASADVGTIDSIISVLYAVISGPVGQPRQWQRFASLFHPQARLMPSHCDSAGRCDIRVLTPSEYRQLADTFLVKEGFTERQIAARTERFGNVAHVFSSYESFHRGETKPFMRGINSIQLVWDGRRWWVLSILWDNERPNNPLPPAFARPASSPRPASSEEPRPGAMRYTVETLPRGAAAWLQSRDSTAVQAIHEFLAFQRHDHRAGARGAD